MLYLICGKRRSCIAGAGSRRFAAESCESCVERHESGEGSSVVRSDRSSGLSLDLSLSQVWYAGAEGAPAWASAPSAVEALAGSSDRAAVDRSVSRSVENAVLSLDAGGSGRTYLQKVRPAIECMDRGALPPALGIYTPETCAARLRTRPRSSAPMAEKAVSSDSGLGSSRESDHLLGRRNGDAFGSSSRALLGSPWANPCHSWDRKEVSL